MIYSLILGALIGWIASKLMDSRGGLLRNLILGVAGSAAVSYTHLTLPTNSLV